jgi:branched-chain amino acid transport system permease protein
VRGRAGLRSEVSFERAVGGVALVLVALGPVIFSDYWVSFILTQVFLLGVAAASLIFLSAYGGMVSLAQVSLYGIAGFALGNMVTAGETKGLNLGWDPWLGVVLAILIATAVGLLFGAVASRSFGIYFLMLTLVFSVIANKFLGQVTLLSGFGGVGSIQNHTPGIIGNPAEQPNRLYYASLLVAILVYVLIRYVARTPFGLSLQGIRDDPVRMASLGYNVALHRMLAFGFAAFVASLAGILFVWWNSQISPSTIDLQGVLDLLVIAVIGGLYRLEGAWLGALVFVLLNNYIRDIGILERVGVTEERFHTVIGVTFLAIVLLSPGGLLGLWESLNARGRALGVRGRGAGPPRPRETEVA